MTALLVVLTILEIVIAAAALVFYLLRITGSLRRTSTLLGKVSFGVRAIETQTSAIGPGVVKINEQLVGIAGALDDLAGLADRAAAAKAGQLS